MKNAKNKSKFSEAQLIKMLNEMTKTDSQLEMETANFRKKARKFLHFMTVLIALCILYHLYQGTFSEFFWSLLKKGSLNKVLGELFLFAYTSTIYFSFVYAKKRPILHICDDKEKDLTVTGDEYGNYILETYTLGTENSVSTTITREEAFALAIGANTSNELESL
ncbi:hypothetical protein IJT10_06260 [bacterium]|nr:hypothetical protein [bacterium]